MFRVKVVPNCSFLAKIFLQVAFEFRLACLFLSKRHLWKRELREDFRLLAELKPKKIRHETKKIFKVLCENVHLLTELYFKYHPKKAVELFDNYNKLTSSCLAELKNKKDINDPPVLYLALSTNEKTVHLFGLIFSYLQGQKLQNLNQI